MNHLFEESGSSKTRGRFVNSECTPAPVPDDSWDDDTDDDDDDGNAESHSSRYYGQRIQGTWVFGMCC